MNGGEYNRNLRSAVGTSAAPYGFSLAVWGTGTVTLSFRDTPDPSMVLAFIAGVVLGFAMVGALAYRGVRGYSGGERHSVELWGNFHIPAVGLSVAAAILVGYLVPNDFAWFLAPFLSTALYLLVLGVEFTVAEARSPEREETS